MILLGDLNTRIGVETIPGIKQRFNENVLNSNGELLISICAINELRINNTFFDHKPQYKYTFSNTRGQQSIIDYVITNRHIHPSQILDIRTLNSANIGSDHKLLFGKIRMKLKPNKNTSPIKSEEKINVESLWNKSVRDLYQRRLKCKVENNPLEDGEDVDSSWEKLKRNINEAAVEALGTRKVKQRNKQPNKTPWFCKEVKEQCKKKKKAYLKYMSTQVTEDHQEYKRVRNTTNNLVRQIKNRHWEIFSKRMDNDFYGLQKQIWRLIRSQRRETHELVASNRVAKETWVTYLKDLYKRQQRRNGPFHNTPQIITDDNIVINKEDVKEALKKLRNRKSPGLDGITNELLKYGGESITDQLTTLINKILHFHRIPDEWRISKTILLLKKGDKELPSNYRGINLLSTTLKLITKILTNKINEHISLRDEQ